MGREVKSKTRGQLWRGRDERSKWDKKLRLHPPVHIRALIVFILFMDGRRRCHVRPRATLKRSGEKKSAHHFHQIDVGCARLHEMPLCIRENLRDGVKRGCRSILLICPGRTDGRTDGRVLHQKEGVYWVQLKGSVAGQRPTGSHKTLGTILRDPIVPSSVGQVALSGYSAIFRSQSAR